MAITWEKLAYTSNIATHAALTATHGVTGAIVGTTDTQELDNKTLDSSVAKGTWTASGTWTIPAVTLGGTVTGGSQRILFGNADNGAIINYWNNAVVNDAGTQVIGVASMIQGSRITSARTSSNVAGYFDVRLNAANTQNWTHSTAGLRCVETYMATAASSSGVITGMASVMIGGVDIADAATVTNLYGILVNAPAIVNTKVTNAYGIYVAAQAGAATLNWGIYSVSNVNTNGAYFVDSVQVVSNRIVDARIDDTPNSGDATTDGIIAALQSMAQTHGLMTAA